MGYIKGNFFHAIPIAHAHLHGICKDVFSMIFDEKQLTKFEGSQDDKANVERLISQMRDLVRNRW